MRSNRFDWWKFLVNVINCNYKSAWTVNWNTPECRSSSVLTDSECFVFTWYILGICILIKNWKFSLKSISKLFEIIKMIARLIVIDTAPLTELFCNCPLFLNWPATNFNCPLLKDIRFNTKCLLVWYGWPVTTCLFQAIFRINDLDNFWKFLKSISSKCKNGERSSTILSD